MDISIMMPAMAIATNPEDTMHYNPLVIYGPSGVGKTHLMLAIRNEVLRRYPEKKIVYVRSEEFTNQLVNALKEGKLGLGGMDDFKNRYRNVEVAAGCQRVHGSSEKDGERDQRHQASHG